MSTLPHGQHDDLMAVADAVGVTTPAAAGYCPRHAVCPVGCPDQRGAVPLHPSVRAHLADEALAAQLEEWAAEAPIPFELDACPLCHDTGLYETTSALGGGQVSVTCPVCPDNHREGDL